MYGPKGKAAVLLNNGIKQKFSYLRRLNEAAIISMLLSAVMVAVVLTNLFLRSMVLETFPLYYTGAKICCAVCVSWCVLTNGVAKYLSRGYDILYKMLYLHYRCGHGMYLNLLTQKDRKRVEDFLRELNSQAIYVCGDELHAEGYCGVV